MAQKLCTSQEKYLNSLQNSELKKLVKKHGLTVQNTKRKTMVATLKSFLLSIDRSENSTSIGNISPKQDDVAIANEKTPELKSLPLQETGVRVCEYETIPIFDQQDVGVCVACAFTSMHQIIRKTFLEPQDIYIDRIQSAGASFAQIAKILSQKGQRKRNTFEGRRLQSCYSRKRKKSTREKYFTLSTKGPYSQWTDDYVDELKENIFDGFPVIALLQGISTKRGDYLDLKCDGDAYHAIVITGYYEEDNGTTILEFLNSYGKGFGWSGFGRMSSEYFQKYCKDMTVVTNKQKKLLRRG